MSALKGGSFSASRVPPLCQALGQSVQLNDGQYLPLTSRNSQTEAEMDPQNEHFSIAWQGNHKMNGPKNEHFTIV